eukprot:TRINITY_DN844_c2_g1_i1.p1 TRINITY_DN844_c2_g1~~TRINITY_DN844_c2_g1_i1.p1  ORF type:complete len:266 (+),score=44.23 TRINITY_DN844_c2_g1_i1:64-798(+)
MTFVPLSVKLLKDGKQALLKMTLQNPSLSDVLAKAIRGVQPQEVIVEHIDSEGDPVTITSEEEWALCVSSWNESPTGSVRLTIYADAELLENHQRGRYLYDPRQTSSCLLPADKSRSYDTNSEPGDDENSSSQPKVVQNAQHTGKQKTRRTHDKNKSKLSKYYGSDIYGTGDEDTNPRTKTNQLSKLSMLNTDIVEPSHRVRQWIRSVSCRQVSSQQRKQIKLLMELEATTRQTIEREGMKWLK